MITIDFETLPIEGNPLVNPPKPIGVAISTDGKDGLYLTGDIMIKTVRSAFGSDSPLLFHNAPFDISVAMRWCGVDKPHWSRVHDTQLLLYLDNPHAETFALKPSAKRYHVTEAEEQWDLRDWILQNVEAANLKNYMQFLNLAPTDLVARYAVADVEMTYDLFSLLEPKVPQKPYALEVELMMHLMEATRHGVRVDMDALGVALHEGERSLELADDWIRTRLADPGLNIDSGRELANALDHHGLMNHWEHTPTGQRKTARAALLAGMNDFTLRDMLVYRGELKTAVSTFMRPWSELADDLGRLHPNWNQTRGTNGGTRTGRLSSSAPNFQNIPNLFKGLVPEGMPPLPDLRQFILPEVGHQWVSCDFDAQEMRILAHFEYGKLCDAFNADSAMDPHSMVQGIIKDTTGLFLERKHVKNIGFGILYGMGVNSLAKSMGVDYDEAYSMVQAYRAALPGVDEMQQGIKALGKEGRPIRTLNGRYYKPEPPKIIKGEWRTFEYKLLNYLIQGSAADQTKMALVSWFRDKPEDHVFMSTVHDEINISVPLGDTGEELVKAMNQDVLAVPVRSTLTTGSTWGNSR